MEMFKDAYDNAWKSIIAPYHHRHNLLFFAESQHGKNIQIKEFYLQNNEGKKISAVVIKPKNIHKVKNCIFYFHGNGGSKLQTLGFSSLLSTQQIAIISFDFIGCGNSDQGYLTYGLCQARDAQLVLRAALRYVQYQKLTVWGRSMGASTAIIFSEKNHKIVDNLILDSPFKNLKQVVLRVIRNKTKLPSPFDIMLFYFLEKKINSILGFSIFTCDYAQILKRIPKNIPTFYIYSENDQIVSKDEILQFYNISKSHREILKIQHGHEEDRSIQVLKQVFKWIKKQKLKKASKLKLFHNEIDGKADKQEVLIMC